MNVNVLFVTFLVGHCCISTTADDLKTNLNASHTLNSRAEEVTTTTESPTTSFMPTTTITSKQSFQTETSVAPEATTQNWSGQETTVRSDNTANEKFDNTKPVGSVVTLVDQSSRGDGTTDDIGFGIRSFTITTITRKPETSTQTHTDQSTKSVEQDVNTKSKVSQGVGKLLTDKVASNKTDAAPAIEMVSLFVSNDDTNETQTEKFVTETENLNIDITIMPFESKISSVKRANDDESKTEATATTTTKTTTSASSNRNNGHAQLSVNSNGMHLEQRLENGLYRIKIAEIITDEFNSGLNDDETENMNAIENANRFKVSATSRGKINIADLYPSKLEDFSPIIRESNERLLKEKNLFTGNNVNTEENSVHSGVDDGNQQQNSIYFDDDAKQNTRINGPANVIQTNIPTTKIEIELIDEPSTSKDDVKVIGSSDDDDDFVAAINSSHESKITDFTSRLQENDGVISTIERNFLNLNAQNSQSSQPAQPSQKPVTVNRPLLPPGFIERRVKKHDPMLRNRLQNQDVTPRNDFGNTKFNGDNNIAENLIGTDGQRHDKPEYSTTKFYNSKELYTELIHDDAATQPNEMGATVKSNDDSNLKPSKATVLSSAAAMIAAGVSMETKQNPPPTTISSIDEAIVKSNNNKTNNNTATLTKSIDQKILFFNMNNKSKPNGKELDRLKKEREQITKDEMIEQKDGNGEKKGINNFNEQSQMQQNKHLYIIHQNSNGHRQFNADDVSKRMNESSGSQSTGAPATMLSSTTVTTPAVTTKTLKTTSKQSTSTQHSNDNINNVSFSTASANVHVSTDKAVTSSALPITTTSSHSSPSSAPPIAPSAGKMDQIASNQLSPSYPQHPRPRTLTRLQEKINSLECDMQTSLLSSDSTVWRGNETHELNLPTTVS